MQAVIRLIILISLNTLGYPVLSAVDIVICEDKDGNKSFQNACPPGTTVVGEKKINVGKDSSAAVDLSKLNVVLYTIPECTTCEDVAIYLKSRDVPYSEKDVSQDIKLQKELTELTGKLSVPATVIGGEVVTGYDRDKIGSIIDGVVSAAE